MTPLQIKTHVFWSFLLYLFISYVNLDRKRFNTSFSSYQPLLCIWKRIKTKKHYVSKKVSYVLYERNETYVKVSGIIHAANFYFVKFPTTLSFLSITPLDFSITDISRNILIFRGNVDTFGRFIRSSSLPLHTCLSWYTRAIKIILQTGQVVERE